MMSKTLYVIILCVYNLRSIACHYNVFYNLTIYLPVSTCNNMINNRSTLFVSSEYIGQRCDVAISDILKDVSRSRVQHWINAGLVSVNGCVASQASKKITQESIITIVDNCEVYKREEGDLAPATENIPLNIVFEDEHIIVIDKQAGLVCHPAPGHYSGTLVNAILHHLGQYGTSEDYRYGIVHRLDKDTSGLMLIAKTQQSHDIFSKMFMPFGDKSIIRKYLCFCINIPNPKHGIIDNYIKRHPRHRQQYTVHVDNNVNRNDRIMNNITNSYKDMIRNKKSLKQKQCNEVCQYNQPSYGKRAITNYTTLASHYYTTSKAISMVECELETGRTHQIRVHMQSIGCNIIGDQVYGVKTNSLLPECAKSLTRQALHSYEMEFVHPFTMKQMYFTSDIPSDLTSIRSLFV